MPNCALGTSCGFGYIHRSINKRMLALEKTASFTWENKIDFTVVQKFRLRRLQRLDAIYTEPPLAPRSRRQKGALLAGWTFTTRTRTHLISLPYSRLLATTSGRSYLVRPVSLSSWLLNVVAGLPLENLSFLVVQGSSWAKTVSFLLLQQRPLNCIPCIWKLVETGGRSHSFLDIWSL